VRHIVDPTEAVFPEIAGCNADFSGKFIEKADLHLEWREEDHLTRSGFCCVGATIGNVGGRNHPTATPRHYKVGFQSKHKDFLCELSQDRLISRFGNDIYVLPSRLTRAISMAGPCNTL
jgi:hypothetical protein